MKKIMTLAVIALASVTMVACGGQQKPAEAPAEAPAVEAVEAPAEAPAAETPAETPAPEAPAAK